MKILRMAWRNVWRNRRRSLVTISAMTLALTVMILYSALIEGYMQGMEHNLLALELGDIQIHHPEYQNDPSLYSRIEESDQIVSKLGRLGYPASPRLLGGALVAASQASAGALIRGLEVELDARVSEIGEHVAEGRWLTRDEPRRVVIGRRLAHTLDVEVGDELILLGQAYDGSMANDLYEVGGILLGISDGTDRAGIFMTAPAFREFFAFPGGAHQIIVRRPSMHDELGLVAANVSEVASGLDVETWREIVPVLASMLDSTRGLMVFIFLIIYIAIGILILNAMLMAVFERIREIGVLKALGVAPSQVMLLMLTEACIQTAIAVLVGVSLAVPGLVYLRDVGIDMGSLGGISMMGVAFDPIWRAVVTPESFGQPLFTLLFIVALAVFYPAWKAATIQPVEAIQHR
jgi:ABC-type lipoprotein release transport system permease subunit